MMPPAPATREALLEHQVATLTGELERLKAEVERFNQERTVLRLKTALHVSGAGSAFMAIESARASARRRWRNSDRRTC